ncbi:MAG: hypothetical protein KGM99_03565 [Burkholderiales bacterium]|nr:hypothetical protein [Burkholderiales bacterium]
MRLQFKQAGSVIASALLLSALVILTGCSDNAPDNSARDVKETMASIKSDARFSITMETESKDAFDSFNRALNAQHLSAMTTETWTEQKDGITNTSWRVVTNEITVSSSDDAIHVLSGVRDALKGKPARLSWTLSSTTKRALAS